MAAFDNSYSRMIAWLKILLPLTALAILSTLFLVSRSVDPTLSLSIADDELQELASQPKIGNPSFSGVGANGAAITLSAEVAEPLTGTRTGLRATGLKGIFETPDGARLEMSSDTGIFDNAARLAELTGNVALATSDGYAITTDNIVADMDQSRIFTAGPIVADGPLGRITAGQLILQQKTLAGSDSSYELIFRNGVKLVYIPRQQ